MSYSDFLKPRPEVLSEQGVDGIIDLTNLFSKRRKALEKDAARFLTLTYPTTDIRRDLEELIRSALQHRETYSRTFPVRRAQRNREIPPAPAYLSSVPESGSQYCLAEDAQNPMQAPRRRDRRS
jgi:hypothetical protein